MSCKKVIEGIINHFYNYHLPIFSQKVNRNFFICLTKIAMKKNKVLDPNENDSDPQKSRETF